MRSAWLEDLYITRRSAIIHRANLYTTFDENLPRGPRNYFQDRLVYIDFHLRRKSLY